MTETLVELLQACRAAKVLVTAEDVIDAAWLAQWMTPAPAPPQPSAEALRTEEPKPNQPETESPEITPPQEALPPIEEPEPQDDLLGPEPEPELAPVRDRDDNPLAIYLPSEGSQGGAAGRMFRAPGAPALPRALELARALRPLYRRVPSRTRFVLDEAETIRRFAEEQVCNPALRPATERCLRLAFVLDTGAGSDLWRETAREFRALLTCLGAFRDVRTWSLNTGANPRLTPGTSPDALPRNPKELIDASKRTLTIVVSPCIAAGWHNGSVAGILAEWADHGPVVLVQLLPEYLWPRTALAGASAVQMTAPAAGIANRQLKLNDPNAWPGEEPSENDGGVKLPVVVLEPASLRAWAGLVAGRAGAKAPGFLLDPTPDLTSEEEREPLLAPGVRVEQFRQTSSPLARRLAKLLAAAPVINLPIIRLIREALLPQAGQPQEAEVLFGGLLKRVPNSAAGDPRFEFHPGVRESLLDVLPTDESIPVLAAVSNYLGEHLTFGRSFSAVLADPTSAAGKLVADSSPFAKIAAEVLLRAGGVYAELVGELGKDPVAARPAPTGTTESGEKGGEEVFPRRFGDYVLEEKISEGPVSIVYRAIDTHGRRTAPPVALKTPRAGAACTPAVRAAFQKESETLARLAELQLPNICHIYDAGEIDGCPYFTMEHIPGETLAAYWVREGSRIGPLGAADLINSVAVLLTRVHAVTLDGEPVLHSNITPQNILVTPAESKPQIIQRFVLVEFGQSPVNEGLLDGNTAQMTAALGYIPPEQLIPGWKGDRVTPQSGLSSVTPRSDVYGLGAVLYWLLTGTTPFAANSYDDLIRAVMRTQLTPPSVINPALAPFDEICRRGLARYPDDRYQSMREFADALATARRRYEEPELPAVAASIGPLPDDTDHDQTAEVAHAELEAFNTIQTAREGDPKSPTQIGLLPNTHTWRHPLTENQPVRVGRDPDFCDLAIPNDQQISRFHATVVWDGTALTVTRRGVQPDFPTPPANQIWFHNKPVEKCTVEPGERFAIGQTLFTFHSNAALQPESPIDTTTVEPQGSAEPSTDSRIDSVAVLRAIERLQGSIQQKSAEPRAFWQALLAAVLEALPRVELVTVIHVPKDEQNAPRTLLDRISTVESTTRSSQSRRLRAPLLNGELVHNAVHVHRRSCSDLSAFRYLTAGFEDPEADWAICTPLQDGSRYALYLAGEVSHEWNLPGDASDPKRVREELARYQHIAELLVSLVEVARRRVRLEVHQQAMFRVLPQALRKHAADPEELERLLTPREQEVTILFCNPRDYASYATQHVNDLLSSQREVAGALDARAKAIAESGGLVVGRNGEAILGFWGWPKSHDQQVELAARAALAIQSRLSDRGLVWRYGLALTHGTAVVGQLNAHSPAVVNVYGPIVNLTLRLEAMTKAFGGSIIVTQEVADRIATTDPSGRELLTRPLGKVGVKDFSQPLWVHELFSAHLPSIQDWQREDWSAAVEAFTAGQWADAYEILNAQFSADPAAQCLRRMMDKTKRKPPNHWDGSFAPPAPEGR